VQFVSCAQDTHPCFRPRHFAFTPKELLLISWCDSIKMKVVLYLSNVILPVFFIIPEESVVVILKYFLFFCFMCYSGVQ
jgi:hypothetical protein